MSASAPTPTPSFLSDPITFKELSLYLFQMSQHGSNFGFDHKLAWVAIEGSGKINPHTKQGQFSTPKTPAGNITHHSRYNPTQLPKFICVQSPPLTMGTVFMHFQCMEVTAAHYEMDGWNPALTYRSLAKTLTKILQSTSSLKAPSWDTSPQEKVTHDGRKGQNPCECTEQW